MTRHLFCRVLSLVLTFFISSDLVLRSAFDSIPAKFDSISVEQANKLLTHYVGRITSNSIRKNDAHFCNQALEKSAIARDGLKRKPPSRRHFISGIAPSQPVTIPQTPITKSLIMSNIYSFSVFLCFSCFSFINALSLCRSLSILRTGQTSDI